MVGLTIPRFNPGYIVFLLLLSKDDDLNLQPFDLQKSP